ncbi:MAG: LptF/LptG family permease [Planctomycetales bacterium]|nr:LptF/LptG family permease [Planctomycetales bacterium]
MRIFTRYILSEMAQAFLVTLASLTVFVFLVLIGKLAVENGLGLSPILRMLPYILPQAMQFAVPGAMLLAATSVYGRVSSSNEIVAVKAMGISPMVVIWPSFALAAAVSLGAVVTNDVAVSWGDDGVKRVILESLEEVAYSKLSTTGRFRTDRLQVNVRAVEDHRLIGPTIQLAARPGRQASVITADEAQLHTDVARGIVTVSMLNAEADFDGWKIIYPGPFERSFPIEDFTGQNSGPKSPSNYSLREISPAVVEQVALVERSKQEMAADAGFALLTGRSDELSQAIWMPRVNETIWAERTLSKLRTEPHRRWANGFSCLGFVLIGVPMAIRRRHGEFWGSFFACFLPILLVYYPMLVGCVDKAKDGGFPPEAVWLGNIVLAIWGVWLMRRVIRF